MIVRSNAGAPRARAALRLLTVTDLLFAAIGLWLVGTAPLSFAGGTYDDLLYARLADSIAHGNWLGPFNQLTLARGPAFPIFLAGCAVLRLPVNLATQAVYLAGALLLARLVGRAVGSRAVASAIFAVLAILPVTFAASMALVMREKLYVGVTLLVLGLACRFLPRGLESVGRVDRAWAFVAGFGFAVFWLTREEGVWLLPALALVPILRLGDRRARGGPPWRRWLAGEASIVLLAVLGFLVVVLPVVMMNRATYGVSRINDFRAGPFPAAYGAMLRVKPEHWRRYVFLPLDVRQRLYEVSPAARELRPSLEGPAGRGWVLSGCQYSPIDDCDDLQGGWSMFALRSAVTESGHYSDARAADRFYSRLAAEIDAACADGRLDCTAPRRGMLPPLRREYVPAVLNGLWRVYQATAEMFGAEPGKFLLNPSAIVVHESSSVVLGPASPLLVLGGAPTVLVNGWTYTPSGAITLAALTGLGTPEGGVGAVDLVVTTQIAPEIIPAIGRSGGSAARFQWRGRCGPDCVLELRREGRVLLSQPVSTLLSGPTDLEGDALLHVDSVRVRWPDSLHVDVPSRARGVVAKTMRALSPFAVPLAMLAALAMFAWDARRGSLRPVTMLAGVLLVALLTRIAMVAIVDATTIPALEFRLLAPGMVVAWALIGTVAAALVRIVLPGARDSA